MKQPKQFKLVPHLVAVLVLGALATALTQCGVSVNGVSGNGHLPTAPTGSPASPTVCSAGQASCTDSGQCSTQVPVCWDGTAPQCVAGKCVFTAQSSSIIGCPCMEHAVGECQLPTGGVGHGVCGRVTSSTTRWCSCT